MAAFTIDWLVAEGFAGFATWRDLDVSKIPKDGGGKPIGHWGGRYIWQLEGADELVVCWKPTADSAPREEERALLAQFIEMYGRLPFANLAR